MWLHVGSVSFTLTFAFCCFCLLKGYSLYIMTCLGEPCPFQGSILTAVHLWMVARKKKLAHPLPEAGHSREHLQNLRLFYFTSSSPPPLCAIKESGIQIPIRWFFQDIVLPSSQSAGCPNKVVFLASTCLWFTGLSCGEQRELGLGNRWKMSGHSCHSGHSIWNLGSLKE